MALYQSLLGSPIPHRPFCTRLVLAKIELLDDLLEKFVVALCFEVDD